MLLKKGLKECMFRGQSRALGDAEVNGRGPKEGEVWKVPAREAKGKRGLLLRTEKMAGNLWGDAEVNG